MEFRNIFKKLARFFREKEGVGAHAHHVYLAIISVSISLAIPSSLAAEAMQEGSREFKFHSSQVEKVFAEDELAQDMAMTNSPDSQKIEMVSWSAPKQIPNPTTKNVKIPSENKTIHSSADLELAPNSQYKSIIERYLLSLNFTDLYNPMSYSSSLGFWNAVKYRAIHNFDNIFGEYKNVFKSQSIPDSLISLTSQNPQKFPMSQGSLVEFSRILPNETLNRFAHSLDINSWISVHLHLDLAYLRNSSLNKPFNEIEWKSSRVGRMSDMGKSWENSPAKEKQIEKYSVFKTIYLWLPNRNEWHSTNFLTQCGNYPLRSMIMRSANDWKFLCSPVKTIYPSAQLRFS